MITSEDIKRIYNNHNKIERLINNAISACKKAESDDWKELWHGVFVKLCKKYNRSDLYNKHLH